MTPPPTPTGKLEKLNGCCSRLIQELKERMPKEKSNKVNPQIFVYLVCNDVSSAEKYGFDQALSEVHQILDSFNPSK